MADLFDPSEFGQLIAMMRVDRMLSVREAAEDACVSVATFSRVENGRALSVETYLRLLTWVGEQD